MAGSTSQGKCPVLLLLAGLIVLPAGQALSQETVYVGGTGSSVEVNLDVLDQLGTPQTVPDMLQLDIRRDQAASGMPLPLPGEARAAVSRGVPMPPPSRQASSQTRRPAMAAAPASAAALPSTRAPRQPTLPTARSTIRSATPATTAPNVTRPSVPAPSRVATPVPSAPKVARTPAPIVAPPAKVAITAPEPRAIKAAPQAAAKAPEKIATRTATKIPDIVIPAAPKSTTSTAAIVPPPPPPAVTAPSVSAPAPPPASPSKAAEPIRRVAAASPAPKAVAPAPKASNGGAALSIPFDTDTKSLPASASGALDDVAKKMNADKSMRVQLLAFASAGERSEAKARRLSLSRALEVRSYLISKGIASTRMDVRALGNQSSSGSPDRVDMTLVNR